MITEILFTLGGTVCRAYVIIEILFRLGRHCMQSKCDNRDFVHAREALFIHSSKCDSRDFVQAREALYVEQM